MPSRFAVAVPWLGPEVTTTVVSSTVPSTSLSFAVTSMLTLVSSSSVALSFPATGGSFTAFTVRLTVTAADVSDVSGGSTLLSVIV